MRVELAILHEEDYNLDLVGFEDVGLQRLLEAQDNTPCLTDEDAVPDVRLDPVARLGDAFVPGAHRVICATASRPAVSRGYWTTPNLSPRLTGRDRWSSGTAAFEVHGSIAFFVHARHWNRPDAPVLADQVNNAPAVVALLDVLVVRFASSDRRNPQPNALFRAVQLNDQEVVEALLRKRAEPNINAMGYCYLGWLPQNGSIFSEVFATCIVGLPVCNMGTPVSPPTVVHQHDSRKQ